jgi:WD40 repeat protein/uncharacterized caspase-like protein
VKTPNARHVRRALVRVLFLALVALTGCVEPTRTRILFVPPRTETAAAAPVLGNVRFVPQVGHSTPANAVSISSAGRYALTAGDDGTIAQWDLQTKRLVRALFVQATVRSSAISADGRLALTAGIDDITVYRELMQRGTFDEEHAKNHFGIAVWSLADGKRQRRLEGHTALVRGLSLFPDGKRALSCAEDGTIRLWDLARGTELAALRTPGKLTACALSPDATLAASAGDDRKIRVWDLARRSELRAFTGHTDAVESVGFAPDGRHLVSAGRDRTARVWDVAGAVPPRVLGPHEGPLAFAALRSDGTLVAVGPAESGIKVWDATGKPSRTIAGRGLVQCAMTADGNAALASSTDAGVSLFDLPASALVRTFPGRSLRVDALAFSADGSQLVAGGTKGTTLWNVSTLYRARHFGDASLTGSQLGISTNGHLVVTRGADNHLRTTSAETGQPRTDLGTWPGSASPMENGKALVARGARTALVDLETERTVVEIAARPEDIAGWTLAADGQTLVTLDPAGALRLWKTSDGALLRAVARPAATPVPPRSTVALRAEGKRIMVFIGGIEGSSMVVWDLASGRAREVPAMSRDVLSARFFNDGRHLVVGTVDGEVHVWDTELGVLLRKLEGHGGGVTSLAVPARGRVFASGTSDGVVRFWNVDTRISVSLLDSGAEWLVYTDDGYFDASRGGADLVAMVRGTDVFAVDQFALKNNRPDVILRRFGLGSPDTLAHYESRFERRLRRAGLTAERLRSELHVPEATIVEARAEGKQIELRVRLKDTTFPLRRYNVYVNDVPLFGAAGRDIDGKERELTERLELIEGSNRIEVSCTNDVGVESYRAQRVVEYTSKTKGALYYVGFGVSKYRDPRLDLDFAHKDAQDLGRVLSGAKKDFAKVETKTFQNEEVGPDAFRAAKAFLESASVDDTVVVFIAGHGVHARDREGTYYYVVHATDVKHLAETAVNFDEVDGLLQGLKARRKLLLLDTCESGELDDEGDARAAIPTSGARGVRSRSVRLEVDEEVKAAASPKPAKAPATTAKAQRRSFLGQRDRFVYSDLARRSGAIVLASSQGTESSYESQETQNGFFTYEIMQSLNGAGSSAADVDHDGWLTTRELRDYVSRAVALRTEGRQNPTIDRDNIQQRVALPTLTRTR